MSSDKYGEIIRSQKDLFKTPNFNKCHLNGMIEVHNENFRHNKQDTELILFFQFEGKLFFPIWFEFRSINNNLLYLFKEFTVDNFTMLARILNSSLEKEEHYTATIKAVVYKTSKMPMYCVELDNFVINDDQKIEVTES